MDAFRVRTALFVPVLQPRFFARAGDRGSQALILDLEDAIAPQCKTDARLALPDAVRALRSSGLPLLVRVNADAELLQADLLACVDADVDAVMLPKVESANDVQAARQVLARHRCNLVPIIETPRGVLRADTIAAADPAICAIGFGSEDLAAGINRAPSADMLVPAAAHVALCAAAENIACWGLVGSVAELENLQSLAAAGSLSRRLGFTGTPAVHPAQVPILNQAFAPTEEELAQARRVLDAYAAAEASGTGALRLGGHMIDRPIVERARRLVS